MKAWGPERALRAFESVAKRAGLTNLSRFIHNLRHDFATALFRAGVNPRVAGTRATQATPKGVIEVAPSP